MHFLSCFQINCLIGHQYTAKSGSGISFERFQISLFYSRGYCHAASISVLQDCKGSLSGELSDKRNGCIHVHEIVIG